MNRTELIRSFGRLDQVASVQQSVFTSGTATGMSAIDVRLWDGVDAQLLPGRGLDLGHVWYHGVPVAWTSRLGFRPALSPPLKSTEWITAFAGGLLTTCGLFNVGTPSEGHAMHGDFTHLPADDISMSRELNETGQVDVRVSGTVREGSALGPLFELKREWSFRTGEGSIGLVDTVTNLGPDESPAPILYHINFGSPFWRSEAWIDGPGGQVLARDANAEVGLSVWNRAPELKPHVSEWAFEHVLPEPIPDWARFMIYSPAVGLRCAVEWDTSTLPRVHQWVHPASTINALGIEPSNCGVRGRAVDRAEGRLPTLSPDESRTTRLRITFSPYA